MTSGLFVVMTVLHFIVVGRHESLDWMPSENECQMFKMYGFDERIIIRQWVQVLFQSMPVVLVRISHLIQLLLSLVQRRP